MVLRSPSISEVEVIEAGEMQVHKKREIRCQNGKQERELKPVKPVVWRLLRESGRAEIHVRVFARNVREMVMFNIVPVPPGILGDWRVP